MKIFFYSFFMLILISCKSERVYDIIQIYADRHVIVNSDNTPILNQSFKKVFVLNEDSLLIIDKKPFVYDIHQKKEYYIPFKEFIEYKNYAPVIPNLILLSIDGSPYYYDSNLKLKFQDIYFEGPFNHRYLYIRKNKKFGLCDTNSIFILDTVYDDIIEFTSINASCRFGLFDRVNYIEDFPDSTQGLIYAKINNAWYSYDVGKKLLLKLDNKTNEIICRKDTSFYFDYVRSRVVFPIIGDNFNNKILYLLKFAFRKINNNFVLIDTNQNVISNKFEYFFITRNFSNVYNIHGIKGDSMRLFESTGKPLTKFLDKNYFVELNHNHLVAEYPSEKLWYRHYDTGIIDSTGKALIPIKYEEIAFNEHSISGINRKYTDVYSYDYKLIARIYYSDNYKIKFVKY